jgi:hypothetical protein
MSPSNLNKWWPDGKVEAGVKNKNYVNTISKFSPAEHFLQASCHSFSGGRMVGMEKYLTQKLAYPASQERHGKRQNIYIGPDASIR